MQIASLPGEPQSDASCNSGFEGIEPLLKLVAWPGKQVALTGKESLVSAERNSLGRF